MKNKQLFLLKGTITFISKLIYISRKNIPDLYKKTLTIELMDGQKLFPEIRNHRLKLLEKEQIEIGSLIELEFTFEGSEKNNKRYNNIYINNIKNIHHEQ